jgi:type VI protein secretion system component Hcp
MTCGTYQLSLEASAARPDVARGSYLRLDGIFAGSPISTHAGQTWLQMWNAKPAFPVAHTDHRSPRPLERSP